MVRVWQAALVGGVMLVGQAQGNECQDGLILPAWRPISPISTFSRTFRGAVYLLAMVYLFIGVSIISDRFMAAIEVITSQEKRVTIRSKGQNKTVLVRVWNETVANLTLMALGSSAPEILLSIIEIYGKNFEAGDLGPGTIVGSAAYNLFVIIAICVLVIPNGETRRIKHIQVFLVTSAWSVFAYIWLYVILDVFSKNVVEVWEGLLTFVFFPLTVYTAYLADRKVPIHKIPFMLCNFKRKRMVGVAERIDIEMDHPNDSGFEEMLDQARQQSANMLKELRMQYPDKTLAELKVLAQERIEQTGPKSRAFYRIQATKSLTGGSVIRRQVRESSVQDDLQAVPDIFDDTAYVKFEQPEYVVLENIGTLVVKVVLEGGSLSRPLLVDYQSEDGTANAGSDYMAVAGTLIFKPGQTELYFKVKIIDDDVFEEDEHFFIRLSNVRMEGAKRCMGVTLGDPNVTKVTILDDDHSGVFGFKEERLEVSEAASRVEAVVERRVGARGRIKIGYKTKEGTAKAGKDYLPLEGVLLFDNNQTRISIPIQIMSENCYERNAEFTVHLEHPLMEISEDTIKSSLKLKSLRSKEEEMIAKEGFPRLGSNSVLTIVIRENREFKETVDELVENRVTTTVFGSDSWGQQFAAAFQVKDEGEEEATGFDYFMHVLTLFWKVLFAFVPPTDMCCGYVCFTICIAWIGVLTAVIGDVASHFGCTIGLQDPVTAITFVALGTSVPDTFASKVAAIQDATADNSIGNVTGSNAVNVFLGIGIAWSLAAIHHAYHGTSFIVPSGNLAFSVTLFCTEALVVIALILLRRLKPIGGELGGPVPIKYATGAFFISLWVLYITLSTLEVYDVIGF